MSTPYKFFFFILILILSVVFLLHYFITEQAVYGDGLYYYAYTHSIFKDHDLNFSNELSHRYDHKHNNSNAKELPGGLLPKTQNGFVANKYAIAAPIAWLPAFAIADFFANVINHFNKTFPINGYADIYQIFVGLENIFFVAIGTIAVYRFLQKHFSKQIAFLAATTMLLGSNLFYYGSFDVINSHPFSFLISSFFLFYWWGTKERRTRKRWIIVGALIGLLSATRIQDLIFICLPAFELIKNRKKYFMNIFLLLLGFFAALLPQIIVWKILYGTLYSPYVSGGFSFISPNFFGTLFNSRTGIVFWTPIFLICIFGLVKLIKKQANLARYSIGICILEFYLISSWGAWDQGESFGIRMFISIIPFLTIGLAEFLTLLKKQFSMRLVYVFCFLTIILNVSLISYFTLLVKETTNTVGRDSHSESMRKIEQIFKIKIY